MSSPRVSFSFFRYPAAYAPAAFVFMGFKRWLKGKDVPAGDVRLMGCGSGDGFSILPDFRTYCLMSALPSLDQDARLRRSGFYRRIAGPASARLHVEMRPLSGHGTWDGAEPFAYSGSQPPERPLAVLTHARVHNNRVRSFWRSVPSIRSDLRGASGCLFHIGFGEHPLRTLATFSIWQDMASMRAFAYRHSAHHRTLQAARREGWLTESIFVRFAVLGIDGDIGQWPGLAGLAQGLEREPSPLALAS